MESSTSSSTSSFPSEILTTLPTRQTIFSVQPSSLPLVPTLQLVPSTLPPVPGPLSTLTEPQPTTKSSFRQYATKLGYPDNLITRVLNDLGQDAETEELLSHLISLQDMLCPKDSTVRRRRDATDLPSYMLAQDSYYKGKERMPFWVWVKRETIGVNMTANPPHRRAGNRSSSFSAAANTSSNPSPHPQ